MKKTFLSIFAAIAAASFTQAAEVQPRAVPQYTVSPERVEFMVKRLEAVVDEELAKSIARPTPISSMTAAAATTQSNARFEIVKHSKKNELPSDKNS